MTAPQRGRIRAVPLPNGRVLLVFDQVPTLDSDGQIDWRAGRDHMAEAGIVAIRFDHPVDVHTDDEGNRWTDTEETRDVR